jgi:hypothetical protein
MTAIGHQALYSNTTAANNTAVGKQALYLNTTGSENTAIGKLSLQSNTTGTNNNALGYNSLGANTTGQFNTAMGRDALGANTTASYETAIGYQAGYSTNTGNALSFNTFIGAQAGYYVTTGTKNTIIGRYTGNEGGLDIRTSSNNIVLSDGDGNPRLQVNGNGTLLYGQFSTESPVQGNTAGGLGYRPQAQLEVNGNGTQAAFFGRTNDGQVIGIYSAGTREGDISVSGTTVSYNGGHLARWSQLTDGTKDETIVKGTVLTNLDQMAVWHHEAVAAQDAVLDEEGNVVTEAVEARDAYTEDNEQLNCMAVSSVEGDPNVAGVFVNWDNDDDEFNDMNIAMTGDMVIRIASGTTVARGDLLMSAGDGTAKPQGDDIVRSKTIAKVTSTNVSHTYDDGSYLVPCVLMAC